MAAREVVDVGEGRLHAAGERLVGRVLLERVEPDDAVGEAVETGHLLAEELGVADLEAVGAEDDDRASREPGVAVLAIVEADELLDRHPVIQRSVRLRNPYVDPMNAIQVDLLRRYRAGDERAAPPLLRSIAGIAAALRNTG